MFFDKNDLAFKHSNDLLERKLLVVTEFFFRRSTTGHENNVKKHKTHNRVGFLFGLDLVIVQVKDCHCNGGQNNSRKASRVSVIWFNR